MKESQQNQINLVEEMSIERSELAKLIILQKNFCKLKMFRSTCRFNKRVNQLTEVSNRVKKQSVDTTLALEQKQMLIVQQKHALKKQLAKLDAEYAGLKLKLDKEVHLKTILTFKSFFFLNIKLKLKEKQNREHEAQQRLKNDRNLNSAKQYNVEKLFEELTQKGKQLFKKCF